MESDALEVNVPRRHINMEFMYIDLEVCDRCIGTETNMQEALSEVTSILNATGIDVFVHKTLVESEAQALELAFVSSPTIRVNGRDIASNLVESRCASCECVADNGTVDCRVWKFQGREYTAAPKAMIIDALLREVYGPVAEAEPLVAPSINVPENLLHFFEGKAKQTQLTASCCSTAEQQICCDTSAKAECCGAAAASSGSCGCK